MIYEYECSKTGNIIDRMSTVAEYKSTTSCGCGNTATRVYTKACYVVNDIKPFMANSGKYITGRNSLRNHLAATGTVEYGVSDLKLQHEKAINKAKNPQKDKTLKKDIIDSFNKIRGE